MTAREIEDLKAIVRRTKNRQITLPELRECERLLAINGEQYRKVVAEAET